MKTWIASSIAALAVFLVFVWLMLQRKRSGKGTVSYVCDTCGEKDCLCHRVDHR